VFAFSNLQAPLNKELAETASTTNNKYVKMLYKGIHVVLNALPVDLNHGENITSLTASTNLFPR